MRTVKQRVRRFKSISGVFCGVGREYSLPSGKGLLIVHKGRKNTGE